MEACWQCGSRVSVIKDKPYHYTECGLDNVYLYGVNQYKCAKCRETAVDIPKIRELHLMIGRILVCDDSPLTGPEIKYLRKELRLKSKEVADFLSVDVATYSRWENSKIPIGATADKLLRTLYILNAESEAGRVLHKGIRSINVMRNLKAPADTKHRIDKSKVSNIELTLSDWLIMPSEPIFCEQNP
jgi:putative zinc finger/helix-turn-helix YgiT family protein